MAKLLSRYDRDIARALLEPLPAKAFDAGPWGILAAVHVDPSWAKTLFDTVADSPSAIERGDAWQFYFVWTLSLPLPDRRSGPHEFSAGFWEPSAQERPLPP